MKAWHLHAQRIFHQQVPGRLGLCAPARNENQEKDKNAATKTANSRHEMFIMLTMTPQNAYLKVKDKNHQSDLHNPTRKQYNPL